LITRTTAAACLLYVNDVTPAIATQMQLAIPMAHAQLISQKALNIVTICETFQPMLAYTPQVLTKTAPSFPIINFEHFANLMVHPVTGKAIPSYRTLMKDPATAKVWQKAFGKDFGGMAQGYNKTGQTGMNSMFVMTHNKTAHA
jgi:hypothetical protein